MGKHVEEAAEWLAISESAQPAAMLKDPFSWFVYPHWPKTRIKAEKADGK